VDDEVLGPHERHGRQQQEDVGCQGSANGMVREDEAAGVRRGRHQLRQGQASGIRHQRA